MQWPLVLHCSKGKRSLCFTYLAASFCSGSVQVSQRSCIIFAPVSNNFGCYAWCVMPAFNSIPTLIHQQNFPPNDACCVDFHSFTCWHRRNACPTCVSQPPAQDCSLNTTLWPGQFQIKDSFSGSRRIAPDWPAQLFPLALEIVEREVAWHCTGWGMGAGVELCEKGYIFISTMSCPIQKDSINLCNVLTPPKGVSNISRLNTAYDPLGLLVHIVYIHLNKVVFSC